MSELVLIGYTLDASNQRTQISHIIEHVQELSYMQLIECESYSYACLPACLYSTPNPFSPHLSPHPSEPELPFPKNL
jgi:hypothetical protein